MKHLDLFSGIGGFALAARWNGIETVAFCEVDEFCRKVLRKHWPTTPIHGDVMELDGTEYRGVDLITGGYPCQPFSLAGNRRGTEDDRHLWPEMRRIIEQARPAFVIAENVLGHVTMGLDEVLADMEDIGYAARAIIIPAAAVGADHRRDRVWIIANSKSGGLQRGNKRSSNAQSGRSRILTEPSGVCGGHIRGWTSKPTLVRGADGVSCGMDRHRIKSLGNAIVPQVAAELMRAAISNALGNRRAAFGASELTDGLAGKT